MRNTKQKKLVYEIVQNSYEHLSATQIYEEARKSICNISLGTVYRILNELVNTHKIIRIKTKYGKDHFDHIDEKKHYHFICNKCEKIIDVHNSKYTVDSEELKKFRIDNVEITFTGLCDECMKGRN